MMIAHTSFDTSFLGFVALLSPDQVEDWFDVYTGFQDACCQDAFDDGCSGIGCSGDDDYGCSGDGSQEQADGYSDDGNEEDALHYGYEEDALHYGYEEDAHY